MRDLASPDRLAEFLEPWPPLVIIGGADGVLRVHDDGLARPSRRCVLPALAFLGRIALDQPVLGPLADAEVQGDVTHAPQPSSMVLSWWSLADDKHQKNRLHL